MDELMNEGEKDAQDDEEIFDEYARIKQPLNEEEAKQQGDAFNEFNNLLNNREYGGLNADS